MIKVETIGMLDIAKVNPVITSESDVINNQFITHEDNLYLVANTLLGDDAGREDVVIKAGEYLNGYLVKVWDGQKLVIDGKHVTGDYSTYSVKDTVLVVGENGKLAVGKAPASGICFVVTDKCTLTEKAIKARVCVCVAEPEKVEPAKLKKG